MLGSVVCNAFKHNIKVLPYSFPPPVVKSGSFVYDVVLEGLTEWNPTKYAFSLHFYSSVEASIS
jgi:hypothetical protein